MNYQTALADVNAKLCEQSETYINKLIYLNCETSLDKIKLMLMIKFLIENRSCLENPNFRCILEDLSISF